MQTNLRFRRTMLFGLVLSLLLTVAGSTPSRAQEKSLYQRLGGYDALAAVVDDFVGRLVADKQFEKFFVGQSIDSKKRIRQHVLDQFCAATGGPCIYRSEEHTSELQSHSFISYAVFCLKNNPKPGARPRSPPL